ALPLPRARVLAAGMAEAVAAIHASGVLHRDLKPSNVILAPDGPKVLDFGIARAVDETGLTRTGGLVGSPAWLSPERYRGVSGPEADVFAWGAMVA
ncbi:protein kinase domain-containing protein, partial [Nocardiopsis lucentensis]